MKLKELYTIKRKYISSFFLILSAFILLFFVSIITLSSILYIFRYKLANLSPILSIFISLPFTFFMVKKYLINNVSLNFLLIIFVAIILFLFCAIIAGLYYDVSWDGLEYHQPAIIKLIEGWNPVYELLPPGLSKGNHIINMWMNHYPKAAWILAAHIGKITGNIEYGKLLNIMMIFVSFFISFSLLLKIRELKFSTCLIVSFILAFNPISVVQSFSFYVDGLLSSLIISLLVIGISIFLTKCDFLKFVIFATILIFISNLKFTGLIYSIIISFALVVGIFLKKIILLKKIEIPKNIIYTIICAYIFAILIVGSSTYIKNYFVASHPLYPIFGKNKAEVMDWQRPVNLQGINRFKKFFISLFAKCSNLTSQSDPSELKLKIPFTISNSEIGTIGIVDVRLSGFGPLFSGIILLGFIIFVLTSILLIRKKFYKSISFFIFVLIIIFITVFINPECWWARLVPQFWTLPVFFIIYIEYSMRQIYQKEVKAEKNNLIFSLFKYMIVFLIILNIGLITKSLFSYQVYEQDYYIRNFNKLKMIDKPILIKMDKFEIAFKYRLDRLGIKYKEVDAFKNINCKESILFMNGFIKVCIIDSFMSLRHCIQ